MLKCDWAVIKAFRQALSTNIPDVLESCYHNQIKYHILIYRNVQQRQYATHLNTVWAVLNKSVKDKLAKDFYCVWNNKEQHIIGFTLCLNNRQAKLLADDLATSNTNKLQHYMLQMWNYSLFGKPIMMEWTKQATNKMYTNTVLFFNKKSKELQILQNFKLQQEWFWCSKHSSQAHKTVECTQGKRQCNSCSTPPTWWGTFTGVKRATQRHYEDCQWHHQAAL